MRILFAIPHYFAPTGAGFYGSERDAPELRARVTRRCLAGLWQSFSRTQALMDGRNDVFRSVNAPWSSAVTVALCTTGDSHLVDRLAGCGFEHVRTGAEPRYLGFECHKVLRHGLGRFDYFCYLEDDLLVADALFFAKLAWFNAQFGDDVVLQPNRFELADEPAPFKLYIDGNPRDGVTAPEQPAMDERRRVEMVLFGHNVAFQRVAN